MTDSGEVKLHFLDYWRVIRVRWGLILLVFLLVLITAGITTYFLPRQYLAHVTLQVQPDSFKPVSPFGNTGNGGGFRDPGFTATQFQILQRKEILYPVIEKLNLQNKWSGEGQKLSLEQAFFKLRNMMDMRDVRNTDLIEIGVYSTDRNEAAEIANAVASIYMDKRREYQSEIINRALGQLRDQIEEQRQKTEKASSEASRIRTSQGIIDTSPESMETTQGMEITNVQQAQDALNKQQITVQSLTARLGQIDKLTPDQLINSLAQLGVQDPTIQQILPLYQSAQAEEARLLNSGLGTNHPRVKSLKAQMDVYRTTLTDQVKSLRASLISELTVAEKTQKALESQLAQVKTEYQGGRTASAEYIEAKAKYIQEKRILDAAQTSLTTRRMDQELEFIPGKIWEFAEPPVYPAKPNVPAYMALAVLVGLIVGCGLAFFIEYLDTSLKTLDDVEKFLGIPVLAVVPKDVPLLVKEAGDSPDAEAYRILRMNIEFNRRDAEANTITVISGGRGEGKSTTLNNLAFVCAKSGSRVLIVDTDLRRPSQHRFFDVDNKIGLTSYLTKVAELEAVIMPTKVENLHFIPSGILPADAVGILNSERMQDLILNLKTRYDLVFFDSPPVLGVSDGSILASEVDITIMVVQHRRFPRSMLQRVKQTVLNVGGNLLGVVLNNVDTRHDQGYQYYTQYYDYYTKEDAEAAATPASSAASTSKGDTTRRSDASKKEEY